MMFFDGFGKSTSPKYDVFLMDLENRHHQNMMFLLMDLENRHHQNMMFLLMDLENRHHQNMMFF